MPSGKTTNPNAINSKVPRATERSERRVAGGHGNTRDLSASLKKLKSLPVGSEERNFLVLEIARKFGDEDPDQGFLWLKSLGEFKEGIRAHRAFAASYASSRSDSWLQAVPTDATEACRKEFIAGALVGVASSDPFKALDQVDNLLRAGKIDSTTKDATINSILLSDENSGWTIIANSDSKPGYSQEEVKRYFSFVRYEDPARITERILGLTDLGLQASAWESAARNAPEEAVSKMADFLLANQTSPSANIGFARLAERYYHTDPVRAAEWCNQITDQDLYNQIKSVIEKHASFQSSDISKLIIEKLGR